MSVSISGLANGSFAAESLAKFALSGPQAAANTQIAITGSPANAQFLADLNTQLAPAQGQVVSALQLVSNYNLRKQQEAMLQQQALIAQISQLAGAAGPAAAPILAQLQALTGGAGLGAAGAAGLPAAGLTGLTGAQPALGLGALGGVAAPAAASPGLSIGLNGQIQAGAATGGLATPASQSVGVPASQDQQLQMLATQIGQTISMLQSMMGMS